MRICTLLSFSSLGGFTISPVDGIFTLRIGIQDYSSIFIMVALKVKGKLSCYQIQALSTRIRFVMKTQIVLTDTASVHMYPMKTETKALRTRYQFQSTPRNIRNLFKMADARFPFLSFILGLISDLIACFQANLALLILQADYSRRRQNIIRLLSLPVSRGGRWISLQFDFVFALLLTWHLLRLSTTLSQAVNSDLPSNF